MVTDWSHQLAARFHLSLPDDVIAWFDSEIWREEAPVGFGSPVSPEEIPRSVHGGLMLPDTLPLLGNVCGDYLCLRIHPEGTVREVVAWLHEGGFWATFGNTLCEALLFDAALSLREKAADPGFGEDADLLLFSNWALKRLEDQAALKMDVSQGLSLESLWPSGLAETAVRRERCKEFWTSGLMRYCRLAGGGQLAEKLGIEWSEFSSWLVDTAFVPDKFKTKLARITRTPVEELLRQDWERASREAQRASELRADVLWPFAVMGRAAERQGHLDIAAGHYYSGLKSPQTSADFTEDWVTNRGAHCKFMVERLSVLRAELPESVLEDGYLQAALAARSCSECSSAIRDYWIEQGEEAETQGHHDQAYWCYYNAGWDILVFDYIPTILPRLLRTAEAAGWPALGRLAELHLEAIINL
jgi:hypothetical protein